MTIQVLHSNLSPVRSRTYVSKNKKGNAYTVDDTTDHCSAFRFGLNMMLQILSILEYVGIPAEHAKYKTKRE